MDADYSNLSQEELISKISQLESILRHQRELVAKVREHKDTYASDFGDVVVRPMDSLLFELINNKENFSTTEIRSIVEAFTSSMYQHGWYESLGLNVEQELEQVKSDMIGQIKTNSELFASLISRGIKFRDKSLYEKLRSAYDKTEDFCDKLENLENLSYDSNEQFEICSQIRTFFNEENNNLSLFGISPINFEYYYNGLEEKKVFMSKEGLRKLVLGNIMKNLQEHAFEEIDQIKPDSNSVKVSYPWWAKFIIIFLPLSIRMRYMKPYNDNTDVELQEKKVRISFLPDSEVPQRIKILIENNGKPFFGNTENVFEYGIGEGSGIGLYSAKKFLEKYNAEISMVPSNTDEYKVKFIINIPTL